MMLIIYIIRIEDRIYTGLKQEVVVDIVFAGIAIRIEDRIYTGLKQHKIVHNE